MKRQITAARREILMLLRRQGALTVDAMSGLIGITPVGVRKHLDTLEIDGLVQSVTERRPVGRPVQVYSLTEAADELFPKAYDTVLVSILRQVQRAGGEDLLRNVLQGRQQEMEEAFRERAAGTTSLEDRVAALAGLRQEAGYMAEWSRDDGGFLLTEHNCALCRVSGQFPQVCESEIAFFRAALGEGVEIERLTHIAGGDRSCTYRIRARA